MTEKQRPYRVFMSAAEPSGDIHCAGLIDALKKSGRDIEFVGVGGENMAKAGCELLESTAHKAVMIYKAFSHIYRFIKLIKRIQRYLQNNEFDLVILCDSPAFNFHIAKAAKKAGIKTLFYVAPQLWAWAAWRIKKLRRCCDKLCCILPFEQKWFTDRGVDVSFVGNPLMDGMSNLDANVKSYAGFDPASAKIALMPGSRACEIETLWEPMQQIAMRLRTKYPNVTFTAVVVNEASKAVLRDAQIEGFECEYSINSVYDTGCESDLTLVASGSATLQVAAAGCPMVIMYQSNKFLWHLVGRFLVKTKYFSLVDILAARELVPEFMPYFTSIDPIVARAEQLLGDAETLAQTSRELVAITEPLCRGVAADNVAEIAMPMIESDR